MGETSHIIVPITDGTMHTIGKRLMGKVTSQTSIYFVRVTRRVKKIMLNTTSIRRMRVVFNLIFFTSFVTYFKYDRPIIDQLTP